MSTSPRIDVMQTEIVRIADIVPYWRNPRRISDEAVNAVVESIKAYGYQQPIVVDTEKVIIMGHTRYSALRRMGVKEIPVLIATKLTQKQVKELRTIDNRTAEYTRWDFEKLVSELEGVDNALMMSFFPEVLGPTDEDFEEGEDALERMTVDLSEKAEDPTAEFICPTCFHQWDMPVSREDVFSGELYVKGDQK